MLILSIFAKKRSRNIILVKLYIFPKIKKAIILKTIINFLKTNINFSYFYVNN